MESEYDIKAYEDNQINLYAVQGEKDSRTVIFSIIEKSGQTVPTSNAVVIDKKLDLTDCTVKMYVKNSKIAVCDGTIIEPAENGKVKFILNEASSKESGNFNCIISVINRNSEELRVVGINLKVSPANIRTRGYTG